MSSPDPPAADFASRRGSSFADQSRAAENKPPGPPLAQVSTDQGILFSIGASICLTLWALGIGFAFLPLMVSSVCIGDVLGYVMDYACPLYDRFRPPSNLGHSYTPLLAAISAFGILLFAGLLYPMSSARTTYLSLLGIMARSGKVVRQQEQELSRARQMQQDLLPKSIPQLRGIQVAGAWQSARAVSGDDYDALARDEHHLTICRKIAKALIDSGSVNRSQLDRYPRG